MAAIASEPVVTTQTTSRGALSGVKKITSSFLFRRLLRAAFTIFFVITLIFFLVRLLPGNPIQVYINQQMTQYGYSYDQAQNMA